MPEQPTERREGGDELVEGQVVEKRKRYVYPFRTDINLVDAAREERLERLLEERGEPNVNALVRRLIDEDAERWGVYDPPQQSAPEQPRGVRLGGTSGARLNRGGETLAEPGPRRK